MVEVKAVEVKAVFIIDTNTTEDPVNAMESHIENIFLNGESIRDYAFIYTRKDDSEEWEEME